MGYLPFHSFEPSHFLFPACETANIDPIRPMKSWRSAWWRLTRAIQCSECGLLQNPGETCSRCEAETSGLKSPFTGFRFHDLRHQAITELAESKASDQPSCRLPDTSPARCSLTIRMSG